MKQESLAMQEKQKKKNRREFMKHGLRTVVLSSLAFTGLSLGWRRASSPGKETSCPIELPCRICPQLPGCRKPEAVNTKQKARGTK
jgi:hypothetical protein